MAADAKIPEVKPIDKIREHMTKTTTKFKKRQRRLICPFLIFASLVLESLTPV